MRRRALLASASGASGGGNGWAYELHLTPEWEGPFFEQTVHIEGDFSEVFNLLYTMTKALGADDGLSDIPTECNITVDGQRLSYIYIYATDTIELTFASNIFGILTQTYISLDKWQA